MSATTGLGDDGVDGGQGAGRACDACGARGASLRCGGCHQTRYCGTACQRSHWRGGHKLACRKAGAATSPPATAATTPPAAVLARGADGSTVGAEHEAADPVNPCPLCLCNEDDFGDHAVCLACGQLYCGECKDTVVVSTTNCPTCRAVHDVPDGVMFKRVRSLVQDRSPGRHTAAAQCDLASFYASGKGVATDHKAAARWWRVSADQGHAGAQHNLGNAYLDGDGVGQDSAAAVRWWRKAADQGNPQSQHALGNAYRKGTGVARDNFAAAAWQRKAAEQGLASAQVNLGVMYADHMGVPADQRQAAMWWRKAVAQGALASMMARDFKSKDEENQLVVSVTNATKALERQAQWLAHAPVSDPGMPVVLVGLVAKPAFNGRTGSVQCTAPTPGRLLVLLDGDKWPTSIRETNLRKAEV